MAYSGPRLEDVEAELLNEPCMAALGDAVRYKPAAGAFTDFSAYVDYGEALRDLETGKAIEQDITVQILKSDVPVKPNSQCRITLGRVPDQTFKPINVRSDRSGAHWEFEVALVQP